MTPEETTRLKARLAEVRATVEQNYTEAEVFAGAHGVNSDRAHWALARARNAEAEAAGIERQMRVIDAPTTTKDGS